MADAQDWSSWLVTVHDVHQLWRDQPTYILVQASFLLGGLVTFIHAQKQGGRWPWFWLAAMLHGLWADNFWHFALPEMDNFWHSRTPLMFLGERLPAHIIILYPVFMYHAAYAASRLGLSVLQEACAAGLLVVLVDLPYDIISVKFVHWTWHSTDPNIFDRHYFVPWNSYYFHASFMASFYLLFHAFRAWKPKGSTVGKWQSAGFKVESRTTLLAALLGMPGGVLLFVGLYHPLHDSFGIHSEVAFFVLFAVFAAVIMGGLIGLAAPQEPVGKKTVEVKEKDKKRVPKMDYLLYGVLLLHYALLFGMAVWGSPEEEVATGLHQTVGPCNEVESLYTPFGHELWKNKYLCAENHWEEYFDFHCVQNKLPADFTSKYTICGTSFGNRAEYITIVSVIAFLGLFLFAKIVLTPRSRHAEEENSSTKKKQKTK